VSDAEPKRFAFVFSAKGAAFNREPGATLHGLSKNQMPALEARFTFGGILLNGNNRRIGTRFQRSWLIG
jgi:hypothetical protein